MATCLSFTPRRPSVCGDLPPRLRPSSVELYGKGIHAMRRLILILITSFVLTGFGLWAQDSGQATPSNNTAQAASSAQDAAQLREQVEQLKQTIAAMEKRLDAQEKAQSAVQEQKKDGPTATAELQADVKDLN